MKMLPQLRAMEDPNDFDINKIPVDKDLDPSKCRDVCWDLNERGAVGETILHLCLLNATALHADLAKRLLRFYPKLINDIYMSDEYYGENVLHLAIVNEDPAMVKYLLNCGADFQERCCGNFMTPEDQKSSRTDSVEHEWVCLSPDTNYDGYVYWGEYPLSFCACLGQEECYRLILARGANPDAQDTNGNTALHMLVIYEKINMFDTAYEIGASLGVRNVLNLTPLTLAAKLARIEMFFHILNIEREIYWQIGSITCAAYPLSQIDTIDIETGRINKNSALNLVVFGDKDEHLELMDGVLVDLLNAKWNAFVKSRFYQKFFLFLLYFLVSLVCFTNRPGPAIPEPKPTVMSKTDTPTTILLPNNFPQATTTSLPNASRNLTSFVNHSAVFESVKGLLREFDDKISNSSNISIKHASFSTPNEKNASGSIPHQLYEHRLGKVAEELEVDSIWSIKNISMIRRKRNAIIKIAVQRNIRKKHKYDGLEKNGKNYSEEIIHNTSTEQKYNINMNSEYDQSDSKSDIENTIPLKFLNDVVSVKDRKNGNHLPSVNARLLAKNDESFDTSENMTVLQETLTKLYGQTSVNENNQINNEGDFEIFLQLVNAKENATIEEMLNYITHAANRSSLVVFGKGENYTIDEPVLSKEMFGELNSMTSTVQVEDDDFTTTESSFSPNSTLKAKKNLKEDDDDDDWWGADEIGECRLLKVNSLKSKVRLVAEATMEVGAVYYILEALREAHFLGLSMFIENLMTAPSRVMFLFSCFLMLIMPLLRFFCVDEGEDMMSVIIMLTTAPYFLFFCRGFKTVGPFVVMIYRMVMGDLLRFVSIYLVFVMGFSQAFYIIFLSYDNPKTPEGVDDSSSNPMQSPMESVMAMFLMSLTNFGDYYGAFERTEHQFEAKFLFVVYMAIVAILLVNMLIAMMGNTYQKIAETRNEWQRQWARIVLVVERGVSPTERLRKLMAYSQPMADGRRALVLRLNQSEEDKEEMKRILEMKRVHDRIVKRRKRGAKLLGSPSGTATASAMPSPCPTKRLPGESTLLQPNSVINHSYNQVNSQNMMERY